MQKHVKFADKENQQAIESAEIIREIDFKTHTTKDI